MRRERMPAALGRAVSDFESRPPRDSGRMTEIQRWCVDGLSKAGLSGAQIEQTVPCYYRDKDWDVALWGEGEPEPLKKGEERSDSSLLRGEPEPLKKGEERSDSSLLRGEPELAISTKSIVLNHSGTVPNRLDDMLGEAVSLHRAFPRTVIGYLLIMADQDQGKGRDEWFHKCGERLALCGPRLREDEPAERWEAICLMQMPLGREESWLRHHPACDPHKRFFERLVELHRERFGSGN